jgi:hypothetical protein
MLGYLMACCGCETLSDTNVDATGLAYDWNQTTRHWHAKQNPQPLHAVWYDDRVSVDRINNFNFSYNPS